MSVRSRGPGSLMTALALLALTFPWPGRAGLVTEARRLPRRSLDVPVPLLAQRGDKANCGPTAVAMVVGAYRRLRNRTALAVLRDAIGSWSWDRFPMRSWHLPGHSPGMTTPAMLASALAHFGGAVRFDRLGHSFLPAEAHALPALVRALSEGRPVIALVESSVLWGTHGAGLHWIVLRGLEGGEARYNDPGDAGVFAIPLGRLWRAWRLGAAYHLLPGVEAFVGFAADRPVPDAAL